jgi:hypothetical protein
MAKDLLSKMLHIALRLLGQADYKLLVVGFKGRWYLVRRHSHKDMRMKIRFKVKLFYPRNKLNKLHSWELKSF